MPTEIYAKRDFSLRSIARIAWSPDSQFLVFTTDGSGSIGFDVSSAKRYVGERFSMKRSPHADASALTFSVVIPVWNGSAHLAKCLQALRASTRKADDIVMVDDGCDDDSPAIARAYGAEVVRVANGPMGPATARNRGVIASSGRNYHFRRLRRSNFLRILRCRAYSAHTTIARPRQGSSQATGI
jgi:cellulose synthase/poly-beta-1,6-N-acetylglucosamine synthase-like glycosyltransferase